MGRLRNTKLTARRALAWCVISLASASSASLLFKPSTAAELAGLIAPADRVIRTDPSVPVSGALLLCGGGKLPERVYEEFHKLAGGAEGRLVVITTASMYAGTSREESYLVDRWRRQGWKSVEVLHTRDRAAASAPAFSQRLREATAVWMVGGEQQRLFDAYADTPVHDELHDVLARGGIIGGTSAGMALAGEHAIYGGAVTPQIGEGFGFVSNVIFDQHFSERRRETRLASAVAARPGSVGFGVDESTGLLIRGRELLVVGDGNVHVQLGKSSRVDRPIRLREFMRDDLVALSRAAIARAEGFMPAVKPQVPRVEKGSLLIVGGGRMAPAIQKKFLELAGGLEAKFVVVPTAADARRDDDEETAWLKKVGAKNVSVVHAESRDEAESSALLEILKTADAVWFGGGRQWRFVDAYEGTACFEAFHEVLRRGGVIGGSSAGATIQGEYLVRGSPLGNTIMMAEGYERGFGFLPGTAVDQHFTQRGRAPDMQLLKRTFPQLLGLGIDEATAVVVRGSELEVVGENQVSVYKPLPEMIASADANDSSETDADATTFEPDVLKPGERYDLERFARFTPISTASAE
ncbi:MAG: cyanophycinase [Planctomycetales bacterium]|nr:cyanophycinase [Planctomycetales bacterium]MBN8626298.1 cyanophycinase [Planctomycetota bacterium]